MMQVILLTGGCSENQVSILNNAALKMLKADGINRSVTKASSSFICFYVKIKFGVNLLTDLMSIKLPKT